MAFPTAYNQANGGLTPRSVLVMGDYNGAPTPLAVNSSGQPTVEVANASALTTGQFTVGSGTGSTIAIAVDAAARTLTIKNTHATLAFYVGPTGVTTSNGHYVGPGESTSVGGPGAGLPFFAVCASGSPVGTWMRTK